MTCGCKKAANAVKAVAVKGAHIAQGITGVAVEKVTGKKFMKYGRTDERIAICRKCEFNKWKNNNRSLWCGQCGCFVPAKARVEDEKCPKGYWEILENGR